MMRESRLSGVSAFQKKVYLALCRVPRGRVTTYRLLAEAVGCGSSRAVGQALRNNPFAPTVPCHRVIASDLRLGGFQGRRIGPAIQRKRRLLAWEGVTFVDGVLADPRQLHRFSAQKSFVASTCPIS
jgi:methylated-DNA-[protein]-cysteine S-methyltransferase